MKKFLMAWYGMADLRASLGVEKTDGPVLGALLADDYSDVFLLGYTKPAGVGHADSKKQEQLREALSKIEDASRDADPAAAWQFIDLFSNTEEAHRLFIRWLEEQLRKSGKKTNIRFQPVYLRHLNDTEGIYEAAIASLHTVSLEEGEKLVTLNLSPGTPVMAFVWAFAALRHPQLKKRLIASPNFKKPPETIALPNEWMEWHGRQINTSEKDPDRFDVVFHLFGEQRMPSLLGVIQFSSKKHVFLNSRRFPAEVMKQFIGKAGFNEVAVDPYDPENVRTTILDILAKMPSDVRAGFNLTGGTKLMYAGALAACRKVNATPFYFNRQNNRVVFLNDFDSVETKEVGSVETFIKLNGDNLFISKPGRWSDIPGIHSSDRRKLTYELWNSRSKISSVYKELSKYNDSSRPFQISRGNVFAKLSKDERAEIRIGEERFRFEKWPDFARYLSGGWLEEYSYMHLEPFLKAGLLKDLRIGLEVSFKDSGDRHGRQDIREQLSGLFGDAYQELDVVFTDGIRLCIVECKAGNVNSGHVMKLQNIAAYFGGIEGQAILASCFYPGNKVVRKKIDDAKNIRLVAGSGFHKQLKSLFGKAV